MFELNKKYNFETTRAEKQSLIDKYKKLAGAGGFIGHKVRSALYTKYSTDMVCTLSKEVEVDEHFVDRLEALSNICREEEKRTFSHIEEIHEKNNFSKLDARVFQRKFNNWYFHRSVDYMYGIFKEHYEATWNKVQAMDYEFNPTIMAAFKQLLPVEFMIYTGINHLNDYFNDEYMIWEKDDTSHFANIIIDVLRERMDRALSDEDRSIIQNVSQCVAQLKNI